MTRVVTTITVEPEVIGGLGRGCRSSNWVCCRSNWGVSLAPLEERINQNSELIANIRLPGTNLNDNEGELSPLKT